MAASIVLAALFMLPFAAIFAYGTVDGTDLTFYSGSAKLFAQQFWQGELYPRWLMDANSGLGAPVFFFYPPVAAYLGSLMSVINRMEPTGIATLIAGMDAAMAVSGMTFYLWLSGRMTRGEAFWGAIIYELMPYRIEYTYLDFNLAQCWALAWFPLILYALDRLVARKTYGVPLLSFSVGLLLLTHLPSSIVFLPVLPVLLFASAQRGERMELLLKLGFCLLLGLSFASIYLLPMALNTHAVDPDGMMGVKYDFVTNFTSMAFVYTMPFIAVFALWLIYATRGQSRKSLYVWYFLLIAIILMMTRLSLPVWELIPPLRFLQFPVMRFYAPLLLVISVMATYALTYCHIPRLGYLFLAAYITAHLVYAHHMYSVIRSWPKPRTELVTQVMDTVNSTHITAAPEYRTRATDPDFMTLDSLALWQRQNQKQAELTEGSGEVEVLEWQPRLMRVQLHVTSPTALLSLHRFYFPGLSVLQNDTPVTMQASAGSYFGFIEFPVPQGDYTLTFRLDQVPGERKGKLVSLLALAVMLLWALKDHYHFRKTLHDHLHPTD